MLVYQRVLFVVHDCFAAKLRAFLPTQEEQIGGMLGLFWRKPSSRDSNCMFQSKRWSFCSLFFRVRIAMGRQGTIQVLLKQFFGGSIKPLSCRMQRGLTSPWSSRITLADQGWLVRNLEGFMIGWAQLCCLAGLQPLNRPNSTWSGVKQAGLGGFFKHPRDVGWWPFWGLQTSKRWRYRTLNRLVSTPLRTAELSCGPPGCVANTSLKVRKFFHDSEVFSSLSFEAFWRPLRVETWNTRCRGT